ncbi:MAG: sugar ABC transporter substrate-binding protein, partial [Geminicoccaceae bacterium]
AYVEAWPLHAASPLLEYTSFIPNHPDFGTYNGVLYKGLQGVETGRLSPEDAVDFLEDELTSQLGDAVEVVDSVAQ